MVIDWSQGPKRYLIAGILALALVLGPAANMASAQHRHECREHPRNSHECREARRSHR